MTTKEINEVFCFNENEVKEVLMDAYCNDGEDYKDWEIEIDYVKTPVIITIKKHKMEVIE